MRFQAKHPFAKELVRLALFDGAAFCNTNTAIRAVCMTNLEFTMIARDIDALLDVYPEVFDPDSHGFRSEEIGEVVHEVLLKIGYLLAGTEYLAVRHRVDRAIKAADLSLKLIRDDDDESDRTEPAR
jgi:hypothetical protein